MFKRLIFFFLILNLPFQLGYHFWPAASFVRSFRVDYLSPTLYLTDIFILLYLFLNLKVIVSTFLRHRQAVGLFLVFIVFNLGTSFNLVSIFAWLRLLAYFCLCLVLKNTPHLSSRIRLPFLISLGLVVILVFFQFLRQSSIGGPFYFLGERPLSLSLPNIAKSDIKFQISNFKFQILSLRPYSTFSHPNSLAGYLLVSFFILHQLRPSKIVIYLTTIAFFLTFSKAAILAFLIINLLRPSPLQSLILGFGLSFLPILRLTPSFSSRFYLFFPTFSIIRDHLFLGVGLRQFIPVLSRYLPDNQISYVTLQPVHNIFLLAISELGFVPLITIGLFFLKKISKFSILNSQFSIILLTGALDHYWWTLPQNQLIIVLAYALLRNYHQYRRRGPR